MIGLRLYIKNKLFEIKNKSKHIRLGYGTIIINSKIGLYNTFYNYVEIFNCEIDDFVYIASGTKIGSTKIGKFCSIGPDCKIGLGKHPTGFISTFPAFFSTKRQCQISFVNKNYFEEIHPIIIGNDVWIGANAIIMDGVKIGDGAIIAAAAVVTKDVQPFSIVAGVPAREIRKRFTSEEINKLMKIKWWERDVNWLKENADLFNDNKKFISKYF